MGKKPDGTPYVEYYISMLLGFCQGPVDELMQIVVKDKELFEDGESYSNGVSISVNKPDLFGGHLREGGLVGTVEYLPGRGDQEAPESLANRVGLTVNHMPGMRGQAVLWFHGDDNSGAKGFAVGCNSPGVPAIYARFRNAMKRLDNNVHTIVSPDGKRYDCNPANMIFEALTHKNLMGGNASQINQNSGPRSFNACAATLNDEEFGMSLLWDGQSSVETYIQGILDHINGIVYFNPFTGKLDMVLLRDDYDPDTLPQLGPDNAVLEQFRRPLWGETINEIVVEWTNPKNEEKETITYQDLGNIAMQGDVVSESRSFEGIRNKELAGKVCARELRAASSPLATATIRVNRSVEKFLPGSLFKLQWPARNIENLIMRVMEIDWGTVDDSEITLNCVEDVFGFPYAEFIEPDETHWEPPTLDPDEVALDGVEVLFRATPKSLINRRAPAATGYSLSDDKYNQIAISTYVLPTDAQFDVNYYIPHRPSVNTLGEEGWYPLGEKRVVGHTLLVEEIGQEVTSRIKLEETIGPGDWPQVGWLGMFVGADEFSDELFVFQRYWGNNEWTIRRGVLDTIPAKKWTAGTRVIIQPNNYNGYDWSPRFAYTSERYKFQFRTSEGLSNLDLTNEITTNRPDRPYRPYRPANCKIEATLFGTEDQSQELIPGNTSIFQKEHVPRNWTITCTWNRRNRDAEDNVWLAWDDDDVPPEDGQTTELIFLAGGTEVSRVTGLTGTSYTFDIVETTARMLNMSVKFISRRPHPDIPEGIESLQGMEIDLKLYIKGYGSDWGYLWGGWPEGLVLTEIEDFNANGLLPRTDVEVSND